MADQREVSGQSGKLGVKVSDNDIKSQRWGNWSCSFGKYQLILKVKKFSV